MGRLPSTRQWALPLDPSSALPPLHPATKGLHPSVLLHRKNRHPPLIRCPPAFPAPYPYICTNRRKWIRNTPAGITVQNTGCRPGIFWLIALISSNFFFCLYDLKAMFLCVLPCSRQPFFTVRRHQPDRKAGFVQHIGRAAFRCAALQPTQ